MFNVVAYLASDFKGHTIRHHLHPRLLWRIHQGQGVPVVRHSPTLWRVHCGDGQAARWHLLSRDADSKFDKYKVSAIVAWGGILHRDVECNRHGGYDYITGCAQRRNR